MLIGVDDMVIGVRAARRTSRFWAPRPQALGRLEAALRTDVVLLRGPTGVGKTALLRQFADALASDTEHGVQLIDGALTSPGRPTNVGTVCEMGEDAFLFTLPLDIPIPEGVS